ncbi:hypothetical protein NDU88_002506 [Pleurodeles waltl]|uniref:Uncharacterized protein n=1 Tax=Pleurodeles waltl TaxID=8319 RepID=A0AAV7Q6V6_PLEWA|nr:hypothetical protein NDU88_002506 [Pleurodeles waltl]
MFWRHNIRVVEIPEREEGADVVDFLEDWLRGVVAPDSLSSFFALEMVHRVLAQLLPPGGALCLTIVRVLHFQDQDHILKCTRELESLCIENNNVMIFPDSTLEAQKQRALFLEAKWKL